MEHFKFVLNIFFYLFVSPIKLLNVIFHDIPNILKDTNILKADILNFNIWNSTFLRTVILINDSLWITCFPILYLQS